MNSVSSGPSPSRRPVWVLVTMFFAPLLIAFALYYALPGWRPAGSTNHGDLLSPARPLPEQPFEVTEVGGATAPRPQLWHGKWSFVFTGDGACDARCRAALTDMRQVRLALNDDMQRVQRVFVPTQGCCDSAYLAEHPGLLLAQLPAAELQRLHAQLPRYADGEPGSAGRVYVVDPLGNVMMSYSGTAPAKGMLEDMKKLLKLSHIG